MSRLIFRKRLTKTDVNHRLSYPSEKLAHLPPFPEGGNWVDLLVRVGPDHSPRVLRCRTRRIGAYRKPVIEGGWTQVVEEKELKEGDWLLFYKHTNHHHHPHYYSIEVRVYIYIYIYIYRLISLYKVGSLMSGACMPEEAKVTVIDMTMDVLGLKVTECAVFSVSVQCHVDTVMVL
ncbi:B3 domain-containing transcription factor NGA4-like [Senna tora]|uniref:B3 domain-containing transcription factor NGA4-like n=1 Tax=Senna tora TaxID=362788 RepID=A0A834SFS9_9FABA|nr:B3 domain-containing transcription factor NGA4-like [Senna tora]